MHTDRAAELLSKYLDEQLTPAEMEELRRYLREDPNAPELAQAMTALIEKGTAMADYEEGAWDPLFNTIVSRSQQAAPGRVIRMAGTTRKLAAAAVLILLTGGAWWWLARTARQQEWAAAHRPVPAMAQDIAPGNNRATLVLSDSSSIDLDQAGTGLLGQQGNIRIIKQKDGQLAYQAAGHHPTGGVQRYNLLTTPRGGQYQLVLPDGSKVWLNAASSLRYPAGFTGKERVVELEGEAYFEIAKNAAMPFRVSITDGKGGRPVLVNVLGTHFNVNAYTDEPGIRTTLLEGLIKVQKGGTVVTVKPGERASCRGENGIDLSVADLEETIAWKNGLFKFNEATLEEVMRQVSRWYDVEVVYVNGASKDLFRGEIYRNVNVSKVLKVLEASGVHFTVEGKTILVQS